MEYITNYLSFLFEKPVLTFSKVTISLTDIVYIGLLFLLFYFFYFSVKVFVNFQIKRKRIRGAQGKTLLQLFGYVLTVAFIFTAAKFLGYSLSYFLLGSTALLVGLGFGLQQLFVDLVSGVILLIDRNINLGDVIRVDIPAGKETLQGKIYHIGLRATLLQTIDNEFMIVPNSRMLSSGVKSLMREMGSARFRIQVHVDYKQDMQKVIKVLNECILHDTRVDKDPFPTIIIRDFKDSSVLLEARFWMKELFNSEQILSDIRFKILEEFNKNEIDMPYPQIVSWKPKEQIDLIDK